MVSIYFWTRYKSVTWCSKYLYT